MNASEDLKTNCQIYFLPWGGGGGGLHVMSKKRLCQIKYDSNDSVSNVGLF